MEGGYKGELGPQVSGLIYAVGTGPMQTDLLIIATSSGFSKMNQKLRKAWLSSLRNGDLRDGVGDGH